MSQKVTDLIPDEVIWFFNWPSSSSRTMALESTQPLTEMSTRNLPGGKGWPVCEADVTDIWELIVYKMWGPWCLTTLWASMACYKDSFTFTLREILEHSLVTSIFLVSHLVSQTFQTVQEVRAGLASWAHHDQLPHHYEYCPVNDFMPRPGNCWPFGMISHLGQGKN
jgi:hypothetical protein